MPVAAGEGRTQVGAKFGSGAAPPPPPLLLHSLPSVLRRHALKSNSRPSLHLLAPSALCFLLFSFFFFSLNHTTHSVWESRVFLHSYGALRVLGGKEPKVPVRMRGGLGRKKLTDLFVTSRVANVFLQSSSTNFPPCFPWSAPTTPNVSENFSSVRLRGRGP